MKHSTIGRDNDARVSSALRGCSVAKEISSLSDDPLEHQLALFNHGIDIARLKNAREVLINSGKSANTQRAYTSAWKSFTRWCHDAGRTPLPATVDTVELYLAHLLEQPLRLQSVRVKISAVAERHLAAGYSSPFAARARLMLSNAARIRQQRPNQKAAITPDQLRQVIALCSRDPAPKAARDAALFLLGFALGWRRSELRSLTLADVAFVKDQGIIVSLGASKTDQEGKGRRVSIPFGGNPDTCPVKRLEAWLEIRGGHPGALFPTLRSSCVPLSARLPIGGREIWVIVKKLLKSIGADPRLYGAHSLRAGCITAAYLGGASEKSIMGRTGHRSVATVLDYVRPLEGFHSDPLKDIL